MLRQLLIIYALCRVLAAVARYGEGLVAAHLLDQAEKRVGALVVYAAADVLEQLFLFTLNV